MDSFIGAKGVVVRILDRGNYPTPYQDAFNNGIRGCSCGDGNKEVLKSLAAVIDREFHGHSDFRKLGGTTVLGGCQNQDSSQNHY